MRSFVTVAALGTFVLVGGVYAQSLTEHAAAAAGATIGTAAGKPISNAMSGIFGQVDQATATASQTGTKSKVTKTTITSGQAAEHDKAAETNRAGGPGAFSPGFGASSAPVATADNTPRPTPRRRPSPLPVSVAPFVPVAAPEPVKEPTFEQVASVQVGTTENDLFAALGKPASHITVPDDDGHMRESCQYWANGRQLGTIRLDNGQVVKVEVRAQN